MRQWRVGTFSMGLVLLAVGLGLLYGQINPGPVVNVVVKWWPVVFVLLGMEVLLQYYCNKDEDSRIKYDLFSIIIIVFIVGAGVSLQAINEAGLAQLAREEINARGFVLEMPETRVPVPAEIKKIVVDSGNISNLKIQNTAENSAMLYGQAHLRASSRAAAVKMLPEAVDIDSHVSGTTLYLRLAEVLTSGRSDRLLGCSFNLLLPERPDIEVNIQGADFQLGPDISGSNWLIRGQGQSDICLPASADLLVTALNIEPEWLQGNLSWTTTAGKTFTAPLSQNSSGIKEEGSQITVETASGTESGSAGETGGRLSLQSRLGQGSRKMTIITT
jgi:hypothetical protein